MSETKQPGETVKQHLQRQLRDETAKVKKLTTEVAELKAENELYRRFTYDADGKPLSVDLLTMLTANQGKSIEELESEVALLREGLHLVLASKNVSFCQTSAQQALSAADAVRGEK